MLKKIITTPKVKNIMVKLEKIKDNLQLNNNVTEMQYL